MKVRFRVLPACVIALCGSFSAAAQTLPSEPISFGGGHVTVGGDVSASIAPEDPGFFNYGDYEHSVLRMLRVDIAASVNAGNHLSVLGEIRTENIARPQVYALFIRFRPWSERAFDIQAGRVPPTFGAFTRRIYPGDNALVGYPLAYQYLTSLRPDSLPASADELLRMRGRGWLSSFSVGNATPDRGMPIISSFRWDTGVQVHAASDVVDVAASLTTGSMSNPLFTDDNSGKQVAARLTLHPTAGLVLGASAARGPFVTDAAARAATPDGRGSDYTQTAWGGDVEYSRDYYVVRFESIVSDWRVPTVRPPLVKDPLRAWATYLEGRYKIRPGIYAAARADYLGFSRITGTLRSDEWDAPVTRLEIGGGYSIQRNLLVKASYQRNRRDGGRVPKLNLGAVQIVFWF